MRVTLALTAALVVALAVKVTVSPLDRFDGLSLVVAVLAVAVMVRGSVHMTRGIDGFARVLTPVDKKGKRRDSH